MVFPKHQRPQICREYEENVSSSSWWSLKCGKIFPLLAWSSMRILFKVHVCMAIISVNSDWTQVMVLFLSCRSFLKLYSSEINLIDCFKLYLVLDLLSSSVLFFFFNSYIRKLLFVPLKGFGSVMFRSAPSFTRWSTILLPSTVLHPLVPQLGYLYIISLPLLLQRGRRCCLRFRCVDLMGF